MAKGRASEGRRGGRPSAAELAEREAKAHAIEPAVREMWVVTNEHGVETHGPLHPLHTWRPGDIGPRTLQGEAWFNARRRMMQGFRDQLDAMQGMLTLGQPLGELDKAIDLLIGAWRAADQAMPREGMPFVAAQLADAHTVTWREEKDGRRTKVITYDYPTWKDAAPAALRRLGVDIERDRHVLAKVDPMRSAEAYRKRARRSR